MGEIIRFDQERIRKLTREVEADMRAQRRKIETDSNKEAKLRRKMIQEVSRRDT